MCEATKVSPTDLQLTRSDVIHDDSELGKYLDYPLTEAKSRLVEDYERMAITKALDASQGNVSAAARQLGIHRQSLQQKMTALGIRRS
jgi:DNA-binding NtrC family response regulator